MEEGVILRWLVATGEVVERGEDLVEIETDKADVTYQAETSGMVKTVVAEGAIVEIGATIAWIHPAGTLDDAVVPRPDAEDSAATSSSDLGLETDATASSAPPPVSGARTVLNSGRPERSNMSPLARRLAAELSVDLAAITGTGPGGRIVRGDIEAAAAPSPGARAAQSPAVQSSATSDRTITPLSRPQQLIAQRMVEASTTVPQFAITADVDMQAAVGLQRDLQDASDGTGPTLNDLVVKAVALALRDVPQVNGRYHDDAFELFNRVNVGIAVAGPGRLLVPVVRDADQKSTAAIARETKDLVARAREGSITPDELTNGTFTVSNLGMFGVTSFTAIVNQGQAAILAVGAVAPRAAIREGAVVVREMASLTVTADHRILYGADGAAFLAAVRSRLEAPLGLLP
jgi:pyruvate dehydrogenase E2 component (dihydrolipoamide acetyltransferase)